MEKVNTALRAYIAILLTCLTALGGVIYNDMRSDISENKHDITDTSKRVTDVEFTQGQMSVTIKQHDEQITGLLELFGNQPTFRQR